MLDLHQMTDSQLQEIHTASLEMLQRRRQDLVNVSRDAIKTCVGELRHTVWLETVLEQLAKKGFRLQVIAKDEKAAPTGRLNGPEYV